MQPVPAKGGSIRNFIQWKGGPRPVDASVGEMIAREAGLGMSEIGTYRQIDDFIAGIKERLQALLGPAKAAGKKVAAYGTSIGATTFTYQYGLGELLSFYVDDDPYRQGLVSPGNHIPVVSNEALARERPDYVVILAPLYADQIMAKNQAYKEAGGTFVKIWPRFEVV